MHLSVSKRRRMNTSAPIRRLTPTREPGWQGLTCDKYFASFSVQATEDDYKRTHPKADTDKGARMAGVDRGIKSALILYGGIAVENPNPLKKNLRKIKTISRQLDKPVHERNKQERLDGKK